MEYNVFLVTGYSLGEGGGLQNGKTAGPKRLEPAPSRQGKTFHVRPFEGWRLLCPSFNNTKTLSAYN